MNIFVCSFLVKFTNIYMHVDPNLGLKVVSFLMSQYNLTSDGGYPKCMGRPPPILHNFFLQVTSHVFENDRKWEVDIFLYGIVYYTWV
jgi:hypothetical protein